MVDIRSMLVIKKSERCQCSVGGKSLRTVRKDGVVDISMIGVLGEEELARPFKLGYSELTDS